MPSYNRNIMLKILISIILGTIIIDVGDAVSSGSQTEEYISINIDDSDDDSVVSTLTSVTFNEGAGEYVSISIKQSEKEDEVDDGYTSLCYTHMKHYCNMEKPSAMDFAKIAIAKSERLDLIHLHDVQDYYHDFTTFLNAADILPPDQYCQKFDKNPRIFDDGSTECQGDLAIFGKTNNEALQYAFYHMKIDEMEYRHDSRLMRHIYLITSKSREYRKNYMIYMIENLKLHPGMRSPLKYCRYYDSMMMIGKKVEDD